MWSVYLWVGLGSALGGMGRLWVSSWVNHRFGVEFPWGTLSVNVAGSFVIGVLAAFTVPGTRWVLLPGINQFFMAGVCGGFTTFSAFTLQTMHLMQRGSWFYALANMSASVALCLLATVAGFFVGHVLNRD